MTEYTHYNVRFVGDYFTCDVPVTRPDDLPEDYDQVIATADETFQALYGWAPLDYADGGVEVERV